MNKRYSIILAITAVAIVGATLFASIYAQTQIGAYKEVSTATDDPIQKIHDLGGLIPRMPSAFASITQDKAMELESQGHKIVEFNVFAKSVDLPIMGHTVNNPKTYKAMTFNEQVPGPTLRVTQGDIVKMTLCIPDDEIVPHSIDMHASQTTALDFGATKVGECRVYTYIAQYAGVFKYHCEGIDLAAMDQHVLSGMYGITIVDPIAGYKKVLVENMVAENGEVKLERQFYSPDALEFQLMYSQLYLDANGNYDQASMFKHNQVLHTINGMSLGYVPNEGHNELIMGDAKKNIFVLQPWNSADLAQYQSQLMFVPLGEHVRLFVENQANEPLYFHIVGEILDRVVQSNFVQAKGQDTHLIGGSQGVIVDVIFDEPGVYAAVNHDYAAIFQGGAALFVAGDPFALNEKLGTNAKSYAELLGNPSDSIPPLGKNSKEHPMVNVHGLYTDNRASEIKEMIDDKSFWAQSYR